MFRDIARICCCEKRGPSHAAMLPPKKEAARLGKIENRHKSVKKSTASIGQITIPRTQSRGVGCVVSLDMMVMRWAREGDCKIAF